MIPLVGSIVSRFALSIYKISEMLYTARYCQDINGKKEKGHKFMTIYIVSEPTFDNQSHSSAI